MDNVFSYLLKIFNFVLSSSLMAVVLISLILFAKYIFKNKLGAKWHYLIWFVLVFRMILPWAPESYFSVFNIFSFEKDAAIIQTTNQENNIQVKIVKPSAVNSSLNESTVEVDTATDTTAQGGLSQDYVKKFTINLEMLYLLWLGVALIVSFYIIFNSIIFELKIKKHNSSVSREIFKIFWDCKSKLNVYRNIPLIETPYVKSPTLVGFIYPRVLLPVNVLEVIPMEQLSYVFIHELVHFKRKDISINLLTSIILIFHWFNPVLWYAFYKMREDQEVSCDALALSYINQNELKDYALTLIKILESFSKYQKLPNTAGIGGTKLQLIRRLKMIKSYKKHSMKWSVIGFTFIIALCMTSLTNPKMGFFNTKALANEPDSNTPIREVASAWLNDYTFRPKSQDEKLIAYIITNYMNDVGNVDYRTITGREGFEYLIPARQTQENVWVEDTLFNFKKNKLIYGVNDVDIEFIFIRSEEATACLTGNISRISESSELPNTYGNDFKALFTLKKSDGKWQIATTPQNDNLAQMLLLPSYEETAIKKVINEYVDNNFNNVKNTSVYIPPSTDTSEQITAKCMINISRAKKFDGLNETYHEQEFILQKIDNNWVILNNAAQNN